MENMDIFEYRSLILYSHFYKKLCESLYVNGSLILLQFLYKSFIASFLKWKPKFPNFANP